MAQMVGGENSEGEGKRGAMMANPQIEDGYTKIANEILDELARCQLSPNQWRILMFIFRKTYGFSKKVDYIANFQIVNGTGLCKAVVSRALHNLAERQFITRNKRHIGFQKDWERWKLAIPSTLATKLAELQTAKKLAIPSTELAIPSTKVSSCAVTQKKKENKQNKPTTTKGTSTFPEYCNELRLRYTDIDFDAELEKFELYNEENGRKLKQPKLALRNWLDKARKYKAREHSNFRGRLGKVRQPHEYTKPDELRHEIPESHPASDDGFSSDPLGKKLQEAWSNE